MKTFNEKDYYQPIKEYLEKVFENDHKVKVNIYETHSTIPKDIKDTLPNINKVSNYYSYKPDLIGLYDSKRSIIIEVKDDPLRIEDLYQLKRYSEITVPNAAFLISPLDFLEEELRLVKSTELEHICNYYVLRDKDIYRKKINIGIIDCNYSKENIQIKDINFYPEVSLHM